MRDASKWPPAHATLFLLATAAWLYFTTFVFPSTPIFEGDVSPIFLHEAVRMLRGEVIYKDFFELLFPGIQYFYLEAIKLIGEQAWIANASLVLLGTSLAATVVSISRRVLDGKLVFLPSLLFLGFAFTTEPDPTHHWFSTLAVMAALALLLRERSPRRIIASGILCGIAMLFTQTAGPAAAFGIALFLVWEFRQKGQAWRHLAANQFRLWLPLFVTVAIPLAYIPARAGFRAFFNSTILFPATDFHDWFWNTPHVYLYEVPNIPGPLEIAAVALWLSIHVLIPAVYLVFLVRWLRLRKSEAAEPWDGLMLLTLVGLCLFASVVSSPSWLRLCSISFPGLIVLVWLTQKPNGEAAYFRRLLWTAAAAALVAQPLIAQTDWHGYLTTPAGREVFVNQDVFEKFKWMQEHTQPGDYMFQASDCSLYYLLKLNNPARAAFLTASGYTRASQVEETISSLEQRRVKYVLWSVWLDLPYPDRPGSFDAARLGPLRTYLRTHYHLVKNFGDPDYEQVWERNR